MALLAYSRRVASGVEIAKFVCFVFVIQAIRPLLREMIHTLDAPNLVKNNSTILLPTALLAQSHFPPLPLTTLLVWLFFKGRSLRLCRIENFISLIETFSPPPHPLHRSMKMSSGGREIGEVRGGRSPKLEKNKRETSSPNLHLIKSINYVEFVSLKLRITCSHFREKVRVSPPFSVILQHIRDSIGGRTQEESLGLISSWQPKGGGEVAL